MINCETLKKEIASFNYHKELEKIECAPIVNEAFPEDFNYSIGEASVFRKFGHYVPIEKNWSFSLVQPCVRLTDFYKELIKKNSSHHLLLFEMADVGGIHLLKGKNWTAQMKEESIIKAYNFLVKQLGLDINRIYINYFLGNSLDNISKNILQDSRKIIRPDYQTKSLWKKLGLKEHQLIGNNNSKTFVLTSFPFEFYAGYRNEVFYKPSSKNDLIEIGTFQFLDFKTKLDKEKKLLGLESLGGFFGGFAVGIERLLMALNGAINITECDHISPIYENISNLSKNKNKSLIIALTETTRLLKYINAANINFNGGINEKRRYKLKKILKQASIFAGLLKVPNFLIEDDQLKLRQI